MPRIKVVNNENDSGAAPRGRGRPPKRPVSVPETAAAGEVAEEPSVKRGRGRPKKNATAAPPAPQSHGTNQLTTVTLTSKSPKREAKRMSGEPPVSSMTTPKSSKRGRPRKVLSPGDESPEKKESEESAQEESEISSSEEPESSSDHDAEPVAQKKRGRPKGSTKKKGRAKQMKTEKPKEPQSDGDEQEVEPEPQPKKKRGRKKKQVDVQPEEIQEDVPKANVDKSEATEAKVTKAEVFVAKVDNAAPKKKRGRPPKAKPEQQDTNDSAAASSATNTTNEEDDEIQIVAEVRDSANPVDNITRAVSPPTATLPQKILATPDGSEKDSDSEEEEEEEEEDGENEKSGSEDEDDNGSDGGNGGGTGDDNHGNDDNHGDDDDNNASDDEEESEDDEPQNSQQNSSRCTTLVMNDEPSMLGSANKIVPAFNQMRMYWSSIVANMSSKMLTDYKKQLQGILTGRVSALEAIENLVPGFPKSLLHDHDRLYALLCQTTGAYPFKNHEGTTLVSKFWLADHNQIGAQIVLNCLARGFTPFDVLNESSVCQNIQNIVRIGIKDILDEAHCLLPRNENVIRREHIPISLTSRLLTAV